MLKLLCRSLGDDVNVKFAIVLSNYGSVKEAVCQSLDGFGVLKEFKFHEELSATPTIPDWAGNRDFEVRATKIRIVGVSISAGASYYFCNLDDCWASLVLKLSKRLDCCAVMIRSSASDAERNDYIQELTLIKSGQIARSLRVSYDDGWVFHCSGVPLSREDESIYKRMRIKDRLSRLYLLGLVDGVAAGVTEGNGPFSSHEWDRRGLACDHGGPARSNGETA